MKVKDIVDILKCQVLNEGDMEEEVKTACGSDMMSDVLAFVKDQSVLLTGLMNPQVVRTAEMMDMHCIVFVRGKKIDPNVVALARQKEITVLASSVKGSPLNGISSSALNIKTLQPKTAQRMLRFRRSTLRIAREAMAIERFVMSL